MRIDYVSVIFRQEGYTIAASFKAKRTFLFAEVPRLLAVRGSTRPIHDEWCGIQSTATIEAEVIRNSCLPPVSGRGRP